MDVGFTEINDWHAEKGWKSPSGISCGYHYIIRRDGVVERGRPDQEPGTHVKGHNKRSIGICWIGKEKPSMMQYHSLLSIIRGLMHQYNVTMENVLGHCEVNFNKTCPNISMLNIRGNLLFTKIQDVEKGYRELIG